MSYLVMDTSAFILQAHKNVPSETQIATTFSVLSELDRLKEVDRTKHRQIKQIRDIMDLIDKRAIIIFDDMAETTDLSVLEVAKKYEGTLYTSDTQLQMRQKVADVKVELLTETRPENILEAIKTVQVDKDLSGDCMEINLDMPEFTYVKVTDGINSRIGKYVNGKIEYIDRISFKIMDKKIEPLCMEQTMLLDQIFDIRLPMVVGIGPAGSGKTFLSIQSAIHLVQSCSYKKLIIAVPPVQLGGKDRYGYLPGTLEEKTIKQFSGIIDNIEYLLGDEGKQMIENQLEGKEWQLEIQSFQNIRGRSIKNSIVIIDEAQNTHPHELKTFITRIDYGSKIILLGDIEQIDTYYRENETNGLIYVADKMYESDVSTNIVLNKTFRSKLAEEQIKRL